MRYKAALWVMLIAALVLAGCSSTTAVGSLITPPTDAPPETGAGAATEEGISDPAIRPTAPAPPDRYRADSAADVGATGRPQLIEFFAYW